MKIAAKPFFAFGLLTFALIFLVFPEIGITAEQHTFQVKIEKDVAAAMRDGIKLFANIYRPDADGKFPVILIRTPYNKERYCAYSSFPIYGAQRGYVVIIQDIRGRYASEGEFLPYVQDFSDGYDSVEWAAALPFGNGKVGTQGCSYLGGVQWKIAAADPPHLVAIFPQCTSSSGRKFFFFGGAFDLTWIAWLNGRLPDIKRRRGVKGIETSAEEASRQWSRNKWKWLKFLPLKDFPLFKGFYPFYYEWLAHPDDGPYWDFANIEKKHNQIRVPAYNLTGWFDDGYGVAGVISNFLGMRKNGKTKTAREGQKLIIGAWTHCNPASSKAGDVDFGPEAIINLNE